VVSGLRRTSKENPIETIVRSAVVTISALIISMLAFPLDRRRDAMRAALAMASR
jgi:hypothetical protein